MEERMKEGYQKQQQEQQQQCGVQGTKGVFFGYMVGGEVIADVDDGIVNSGDELVSSGDENGLVSSGDENGCVSSEDNNELVGSDSGEVELETETRENILLHLAS